MQVFIFLTFLQKVYKLVPAVLHLASAAYCTVAIKLRCSCRLRPGESNEIRNDMNYQSAQSHYTVEGPCHPRRIQACSRACHWNLKSTVGTVPADLSGKNIGTVPLNQENLGEINLPVHNKNVKNNLKSFYLSTLHPETPPQSCQTVPVYTFLILQSNFDCTIKNTSTQKVGTAYFCFAAIQLI